VADPKIVLAPVLDPDVLAVGQKLLPSGFDLQVVPMERLPEASRDADFVMGFVRTMSDEDLLAAKRLKLVQLMSVGYDKFNLEGARKARIPVALNGGANAIAVAEHAIMLMLSTVKHLVELDHLVRTGGWRSESHGGLRVYELWSSTIGILGMGRIGQEVAKRLQAWDAKLVYHDPYRLRPEREREIGVTYLPFDELMRTSDIVSVHVPLNAETRHLVNARALALMKPTAVIVNTARGPLIDEDALVEALKARKILGAGLDVLNEEPPPDDHPIFALDNVILTPHMAGPTWQSWPRRFENSFANIARVARGEKPQGVVPEVADLVK
jgi:glyoxylate reductase/D-3-phosphoglycerate dehydrogenase